MRDAEAIEMMKRASSEIRTLRAINAALSAKAEAYDTIRTIIDMVPERSVGMSEDIAWLFDNRVKELQDAIDKAE